MTIAKRRILLIVLAILFLLLVPLILLSALGIRYDAQTKKIIKTGVLVVETKPRGATIILNDKTLKKTSPARLTYLLPGTYELRVEKDGYLPWQKEVEVFPSYATINNNIVLLRKGEPRELSEVKNVRSVGATPFTQEFLIEQKSDSQIVSSILNVDTVLSRVILQNKEEISLQYEWSTDQQRLLIKQNGEKDEQYSVYEYATKQTIPLVQFTNLRFSRAHFLKDDSRFLYGSVGNSLYRISLESKTVELVGTFSSEVKDFLIKENLYIAFQNSITRSSLSEPERFTQQIPLESFSTNALSQVGDLIILHDTINGEMLLFNQAGELLETINVRVKSFSLGSHDELLIYNDFELWLLVYKKNQPTLKLLLRTSEPITKALLHPGAPYIFYIQGGILKVRVADETNANVYELSQVPVKDFALNNEGKAIYFVTEAGQMFTRDTF